MESASTDQQFMKRVVDAALKLTFIALLSIWCFEIIKPFLIPVVWAAIIAVAIYPLFKKLVSLVKGKINLAAFIFSAIAIALLVTPVVMLTSSSVDGVQTLLEKIEQGTLSIPPPPTSVAEWPVIGEQIHNIWSLASENIETAIKTYAPQLKTAGEWLFGKITGTGLGLLQFIISLLIAGVFLTKTESTYQFFLAFSTRLTAESGKKYADLTIATIRSVAQGVLGVAVIQALMSAVGLLFVDVPVPGLWAFLVLLLAIMQLPTILVLGPIAVYVFSIASSTTATVFLIWCLIVSASDAVLKPLFLGRGMDIPMLVILIGAIGGMISSGIIGLFIGAIVLALGYTLFKTWLEEK